MRRAASRLGLCLLKNTHNLRLKFLEIERQHRAPWMQDQVAARRQQFHVAAKRLSHAALDAVPLMSLAKHLAGGEADTRASRGLGNRAGSGPRSQKPAHGRRLALAAGRIGALIIRMLPQARAGQ